MNIKFIVGVLMLIASISTLIILMDVDDLLKLLKIFCGSIVLSAMITFGIKWVIEEWPL